MVCDETISIIANDMRETSMLNMKDAKTFALKISFKDRGQYNRVSRVCFSFSPVKDVAAIMEATIMGIIRKKIGKI